ncbi:unnamed protein product [Trichobilharzia szidati]|nr:unnamed protein product [Trichobilharzia szidati]
MSWNLYFAYFLITIAICTTHTLSLPSSGKNYESSFPSIREDIDKDGYDNALNSENVLLSLAPLYKPISSSKVSTTTDTLSTLSIPNEEELLQLQSALSAQVTSEITRAIQLEQEASESVHQAESLQKAALEAKNRAKVAREVLKSLKSLWNNDKRANILDDESDKIRENNIMVPIIDHDYLLDERKIGPIDNDYRAVNEDIYDKIAQSHNYGNDEEMVNLEDTTTSSRYKRRKNLPSLPKEFIHFDNDDIDTVDLLKNSEQNTRRLSEAEQLTLEKIRLYILKQLIHKQKEEEGLLDEPYHPRHQSDIEDDDHNDADRNSYVNHRNRYYHSRHTRPSNLDYQLSESDLQPWLVINKPEDDENYVNSEDEPHIYGMPRHLLRQVNLNTINNEDPLLSI